MSWSYLKMQPASARCSDSVVLKLRFWSALAGCAAGVPVLAAEVYVQPVATVSAETNTNINMDPAGSPRVEAYSADAATMIGVATPDWDTNVRPRIRYSDYPQESGLNRVEGMLDFNTHYRSPRSDFIVMSRYDHLNDTEAEIPSAQFNELNPNSPGTSDAGRTTVGVTRDYFSVQPRYRYSVSKTVSLGAGALYQTEAFSPSDINGHTNFNYYQGDLSLSRKLTERADVSVGAFSSRFETQKVVSTATATGANLGLDYDWSPTFGGYLIATYQRSDVNSTLAPVFKGTTDNWGASGGLAWKGEARVFRINLGRTITPGSGGGLYSADQFQVELDQDVSERLSYAAAVRAVGTRGLWTNIGSADRNYVRGDLSAKWMLARTWFVQGGFSYNWQKYHTDPQSANNSQFFVRFGYQGLPPQR